VFAVGTRPPDSSGEGALRRSTQYRFALFSVAKVQLRFSADRINGCRSRISRGACPRSELALPRSLASTVSLLERFFFCVSFSFRFRQPADESPGRASFMLVQAVLRSLRDVSEKPERATAVGIASGVPARRRKHERQAVCAVAVEPDTAHDRRRRPYGSTELSGSQAGR